MAKKKPTTKTKKLHPGGSVDGRTPVTGTAPVTKQQRRTVLATDLAPKQRRNNVGQMKPVTGRAEIAPDPAPSPTQRAVAVQQPGELIPGPSQRPQPRNPSRKEIAAIRRRQRRNASPFMRNIMRQQRRLNRLQRQNPSMPTAGVSQGRPVRSITPMPGPAPDAARMRRMQRLMRQQQRRFNQQNRRRARPMTPTAGSRRPPPQLINRISNRPRRRPRVELA